jgi:hypothetical protein
MRERQYNSWTMELLGKMFFPKLQASRRSRDVRFLFLSIFLGVMFCVMFGCILLVLNKQGKI